MTHWLRVSDVDQVDVWIGRYNVYPPQVSLKLNQAEELYGIFLHSQPIGSVHKLRVEVDLEGDPILEEGWYER